MTTNDLTKDIEAPPPDRLGEADEDRCLPGRTSTEGVASTIAFLLGDQAREITGQVLVADGGTIFI
nr:SDR family oxidoreductase [Streptomyces sp. NBC_00899]